MAPRHASDDSGFSARPTIIPGTPALYGLREAANRVHFFLRDGSHARYNLENGTCDEQHVAAERPEAFGGRVGGDGCRIEWGPSGRSNEL